jgi:hypothetical protein
MGSLQDRGVSSSVKVRAELVRKAPSNCSRRDHPMPPRDSSLDPIIMASIQSIHPSPVLMGTESSIVGLKNTQDSRKGHNNGIIQDLIMRLEHLESSNLALRTKVRELTNKVAKSS